MRKLLILLFLSIPAWGQITDYNVPRTGIGMTVCIGPGSNTFTGPVVAFLGSCLTMTGNATNFGYLDPRTGTLTVNTTGAPRGACPIFEADTDFFQVNKIRDKRPSGCSAVGILSGTGSPTGVLTAPIGVIYGRTDGTSGTTLYMKTSGNDNLGWEPVPVNLSPLSGPEGYLYWQPSNLLTQTCATNTITVSGARANTDFIAYQWPSGIPANLTKDMWISASDTVTIQLCNPTASTINFSSSLSFGVKVVR